MPTRKVIKNKTKSRLTKYQKFVKSHKGKSFKEIGKLWKVVSKGKCSKCKGVSQCGGGKGKCGCGS